MNSLAPDWAARTGDGGTGCYVHLPFCHRICPYCDFAVVRYQGQPVSRYLRALHAEIDAAPRTRIQTLYFGGGTPSALSSADLGCLVEAICKACGVAADSIECTLEANPSRGAQDLPEYRGMGINRLSIGVQSFADDELHRLGRDHSGAEAAAYIRAARASGFTNVSIDLIAGVPGQDIASFERSMHQALELEPDHVSVYGLTIEPGTPYAIWQAREPQRFADDDAQAELLERAEDLLTAAGFEHYELSNYARPGFSSAHNLGYWRQRNCLAFGLSAAGYRDGVRFANLRHMDAYCDAIESGRTPRAVEERLSAGARLGEAAMLALRTSRGLGFSDFKRRFGVDPRAAFALAIEKSKAAGLLEEGPDAIRLSRRGRLLANTACALFLEPSLCVA
jgi:oxygen-independent coproporphyrinogen-3 oxidase